MNHKWFIDIFGCIWDGRFIIIGCCPIGNGGCCGGNDDVNGILGGRGAGTGYDPLVGGEY